MAEGARFESGVYGYVRTYAVINVNFPIDKKGEADISCRQCPYYRTQSRTCGLTESLVPWGEKFVAPDCPLKPIPEAGTDEDIDRITELYGDE